jgi:O-methyltransferase involved in polyketide biosynthesis
LAEGLANTDFSWDQPAFFMWLGVVPYLTRDAVLATLSTVAGVPNGEVVFDYGEPPETFPAERRAGYEALIAHVAALGEPWLSFFKPADLLIDLKRLGFSGVEDLGPREIALRYSASRHQLQIRPEGMSFVLEARSDDRMAVALRSVHSHLNWPLNVTHIARSSTGVR